MKFDIDKIRRLMEKTASLDIESANNLVHREAPEWRHTAVLEGIVCGSVDPVYVAREYNAIAGEQAVEYASGKVKLSS